MAEELNCSEGARMLIERMQTHPKDFKGNGRFAHITDQILGNVPTGYSQLSDRDDDALSAAYDKYILEPQLTEFVVDEIFNGDKRREEEQKAQADRYTKSLAASMMATKNQIATNMLVGSGFSDPRMALQGGVYNPAQGQVTHISNTSVTSSTSGQQWFAEERKRIKEMTDLTLKKLKRNKSK